MVYFGCSTWPNKGRWLLVAVFCALGIILAILHTHETSQCVKCSEAGGVEYCQDYKQGEDADWSGMCAFLSLHPCAQLPVHGQQHRSQTSPHPNHKPTSDTQSGCSRADACFACQDKSPNDCA